MSKRIKLTNSSDETDFSSLVSGDCVFTIPYFQRPYKWKASKLKQLNEDILTIIDATESHFMGAIIIHGQRSNPADPNTYDIIDGQQRITTLILYLCAIVRTLCLEKEYDDASGLFLKYLVIARETRLASNIKLHPCKEDRAQINFVFNNLLSDLEFCEKLGGFNLKLLPSTGADRGQLRNNYKNALRFMKEQFENEGKDRILDIYTAIVECISVVQIDVWDPTNGPKIFDGLNSHQEPMTIGDLVRNEIFSRVTKDDSGSIDQIDEQKWQPFYKKFQQNGKNHFDSYFFPYGLIQNPNLKKSEVYNSLREGWKKINDPEIIIDQLSEFQDAFLDIVCGGNFQEHKDEVAEGFQRLTSSKLPSSTYPFLVQLSNSIKDSTVTINNGLEVINVIESFLVRRAVCGHEPTGLHAVFKRLWADCKKNPTKDSIIKAIKKHKTVNWPNEDVFRESIISRPLYGSAITPFILLQYDLSLKGDNPNNVPWIEHVLPDKMSKDWESDFSKEEHSNLKDTLANLIPLTSEMNRSLGNKGYSHKKQKYSKDSSFKSTREFAKIHNTWTPEDINKRAIELADWAITRWAD